MTTIFDSKSIQSVVGCHDTIFERGLDVIDFNDVDLSKQLDIACTKPCSTDILQDLLLKIQQECEADLAILSGNLKRNETIARKNSLILEGSIAEEWSLFYLAMPMRQGMCSHIRNGVYSAVDIRDQTQSYLQKLTSNAATEIELKLTPPNAQITYLHQKNLRILALPDSILCSDGYQKISNLWINFVKRIKPPAGEAARAVDELLEPLKENLPIHCSNIPFPENPERSNFGVRSFCEANMVLIFGSLVISMGFGLI
ncbi:hypothetical protein G9A89_009867 [Geosiphon pyriformis]|nr:hypothetical protein G9A89_009867 [Geosiphon pyriformis]